MTELWTTAKGGRYHRIPACGALAEGQSRATAEGRWTYTAKLLPLNSFAPAYYAMFSDGPNHLLATPFSLTTPGSVRATPTTRLSL